MALLSFFVDQGVMKNSMRTTDSVYVRKLKQSTALGRLTAGGSSKRNIFDSWLHYLREALEH